jgi:integrator complex subunit 6
MHRRWIFGGTGLTTRGLHVDGTNNDGDNSHHCPSADEEPLIVLAGVGAESVNETNISLMGDFRYVILPMFDAILVLNDLLTSNIWLIP